MFYILIILVKLDILQRISTKQETEFSVFHRPSMKEDIINQQIKKCIVICQVWPKLLKYKRWVFFFNTLYVQILTTEETSSNLQTKSGLWNGSQTILFGIPTY